MSSQEVNYAETMPGRIIRYLKDWDNDSFFKKFIEGDSSDMEIPTDIMPCVIVDPISTKVSQGPTGRDIVTEIIKISLVLNKKDYLLDMGDVDDDTVSWKKKLKLIVEGQDPTTQFYDPTTIMGTLRKNFTLGGVVTNQAFDIRYGEVPRLGADETTGECHISMTLDRYVDTPSKV